MSWASATMLIDFEMSYPSSLFCNGSSTYLYPLNLFAQDETSRPPPHTSILGQLDNPFSWFNFPIGPSLPCQCTSECWFWNLEKPWFAKKNGTSGDKIWSNTCVNKKHPAMSMYLRFRHHLVRLVHLNRSSKLLPIWSNWALLRLMWFCNEWRNVAQHDCMLWLPEIQWELPKIQTWKCIHRNWT